MKKNEGQKIYELVIPKNVQKDLASINKTDALKIVEKLEQLANCLVNLDIKKLAGFKSLYRVRCGNYRIIYEVQEEKVIIHVIAIGHRSTIYEKLKKIF